MLRPVGVGRTMGGKMMRVERIPTGFQPPAQGCEERATLGLLTQVISNPNGVASFAAKIDATPLRLEQKV
jgi:hypothetical protein